VATTHRRLLAALLALAVAVSLAVALAPPQADAGAPGPTAAADDGARIVHTGREKWAVLLCRFADSPQAKPFTRAEYDAAFNTDAKSHKRFFKEASYGELIINADVYNWKRIRPRAFYGGDFNTDGGYDFLNKIFRTCTKKHDAGVDFSKYDGIALFLDDRELDVNDGTACGFGDTCTDDRRIGVSGAAWVNHRIKVLDGTRGFRVIWMSSLSSANNEVTAHELAHAYGAPHSAAAPDDFNDAPHCYNSTMAVCGHPWDLMTSAWTGLPTDTHMLAATKVFHHKWITGERRCNVRNDGVFTFDLERLAKARTNDRCLAIAVEVDEGVWYVVEARFPVGFDSDSSDAFGGGGVPGAGVIISWICMTDQVGCHQEPIVLGMDDDDDFQIDENSAEWQPGESFTDRFDRVTVEVLSKGAGFYTVRVTRTVGD
jgi:M6 family metalloprotease-like protein